MTSSRIDTEDPGAVPGASTISTSVLAAPEMTYAGECKSNSAYVGGEIRIDWCNKNEIETKSKRIRCKR